MKSKSLNYRFFNVLSCILVLATLVVLFLPCWSHSGNAISMGDVAWFTTDEAQRDFITFMTSNYKAYGLAFSINDAVTAPVAMTMLGILAIGMFIFFRRSPLPCFAALAGGVVALFGFFGTPMYMWGTFYMISLVLSGLVALSGWIGVVLFLVSKYDKK